MIDFRRPPSSASVGARITRLGRSVAKAPRDPTRITAAGGARMAMLSHWPLLVVAAKTVRVDGATWEAADDTCTDRR